MVLTCAALLVLAGLVVSERWLTGTGAGSWGETAAGWSRDIEREITGTFDAFQGEALRSVRSAASSILAAGVDTNRDRARLFDLLGSLSNGALTVEYYDDSGQIIAWNGPRGTDIDPVALRGGGREDYTAGGVPPQISRLIGGPIYSYLVVVAPIFRHDSLAGHVVAKSLFSANHPVNNRFINVRALAGSYQSIVEERTGARVSFRIRKVPAAKGPADRAPSTPELNGSDPENLPTGSPLLVTLRGISGEDIGYVLVPRPDRAIYEAGIRAEYGRWENLSGLAALVLILFMIGRTFPRRNGNRTFIIYLIGCIWAVRYAMVYTDIPAVFFGGDLFDPTLFASSFGYGAARSLGDLFLSALALASSMILLDGLVVNRAGTAGGGGADPRTRGGAATALSVLGLLVLIGLLGPLSRAFHAVIQSAVFDSRIDLNDPKLVFPGVPMAALLLGIALLIYSSILAGVTFLGGGVKIVGRLRPGSSPAASWTVVVILTIFSSVLFDLLHPNPLGTPWGRLLMFGGLIVLALVTGGAGRRGVRARRSGALLIVALTAIGVMIPLLDAKVHEHDRVMVETAVRELARPEDAWMNYLVGESLTDMSDTVSAEVLLGGDWDAVGRLAFTAWAKSVLAGEGNNCSVTFVDREGSVVSYFHAGLAPHWSRELHMDEMPRSTRFISHGTRTLRGRPTSWYRGYAPVFASDGTFAGGVWVGTSPNGPEKIFGQEVDLLSLFPKSEVRTGVRRVLLAEYFDGRLLTASDDDIPWGRSLAGSVPGGGPPPGGSWVEDTFGGRDYLTFYLPTAERSVIGVSMESLDFGWHFYSYSRYLIFFFVVFVAIAAVYMLKRFLEGGMGGVTFRSKLIAAFAAVSVVPVVLLAYYNRQSSQADAADATSGFLQDQTGLVLAEIQQGMGLPVPYELARYGDDDLEEVAARLKTDFTLYTGPTVQASSRPELFSAELIDTRISAGAYSGIFLHDLNFFMEEQNIGTTNYLVGYRPVRSQAGDVIGAVSVPSLSRQNRVEETLAKDDVLLYGIYILVLCVALVIGTLIANQISQPVRRLTAAARRVATGDLDVTLEAGRGDELGELESAFQAMTSDLKDVQERIVKAERELAWKEMARQVAHEIRNPLTPMRLSLQHLVSAYRKNAADFGDLLTRISATILEQIESLNRIATEFSGFARFPERKLMVCDLHEVLGEVVALHQQGAVRFDESFTTEGVAVRADREELRRAFMNIVRNSIQASGGSVKISITTAVRGRMAAVVITDDGPGMTADVQARLFEPNFSTKTDGMGIGLTIVRKIVVGLGGTIDLSSTPGHGTTVSVSLPLADTDGG